MNSVSKKLITGAVAVLIIISAAFGTVFALEHIKGKPSDSTQVPINDKENNTSKPTEQTPIESARTLEKKAADLMETDREAASKAYEEAAKEYKEAGAADKAAQMEASAETSRPTVNSSQQAPEPNTSARGAAQ